MPRQTKSLKQKIYEARLKLHDLEEEYATQMYLETMPDYDPMYTYCYSTSNRPIPYPMQSVDAWVRAIIKHMAGRRRGHGGGTTKAIVLTIPHGLTESGVEGWLEHITPKLRKRATNRRK